MSMEQKFRYDGKTVHDLVSDDGLIRIWSSDSINDKSEIIRSFLPLFKHRLIYPYVALMPDFHPGQGAMIGSVIPTRDVLLPSAVGGDIGCGVIAVQLSIPAENVVPQLEKIHRDLLDVIPVGSSQNSQVSQRVMSNKLWEKETNAPVLNSRSKKKLHRQFASLGGGNHFLEVQQDESENVWLMLHSGSRFFGVAVRDYYIEKGATTGNINPKLYSKFPVLPSESAIAQAYLSDLALAMEFARESRKEMMIRALEVFEKIFHFCDPLTEIELAIDIAHNFVALELHWNEPLYIHRKGATVANLGTKGLIPGSMGSKSYVVEGRGNQYSFNSCSHGAGRTMSRADAFRRISDKDFEKSVQDVVHSCSERLKDESPLAYKNIESVMRGQRDLVKVSVELIPLLSIKGE